MTPEYLKESIPKRIRFLRRLPSNIPVIPCRTEKFQNSFYPNSIKSWNNLDSEIRNVPSLALFQKQILTLVRPPKKETFGLSDRKSVERIFQIRLGLSQLKSHKLKHNFNDTPNENCSCGSSCESTYHFFLECPNFNPIRRDLFREIESVLIVKNLNFHSIDKIHLLLYGHRDLDFRENRRILEFTAKYIARSERLD